MLRKLLLSTIAACILFDSASAADRNDFEKSIAPILAQRCLACHSGDKPESGFRLETRAALFEGGYTGKAVVPGSAAKSRLIQVLDGTDPDGIVMPPKDKGDRVPAAEIARLRTWIDQGAEWPEKVVLKSNKAAAGGKHWAFQPIDRPPVPAVAKSGWPRNAIDHFVLARLESEGLSPSPEANRLTLLRRVTLDLIGLPPSPDEIDAFLADDSPDAYERVVDRLLASPHYGEKWARPWLDLCHYADTDGYLTDQIRPVAWRYRQWLVDALNENMPFDEFTIEQLAGDLLPDATIDQRIATGFLRNTLSNREGGADIEEYRVEQIVDRAMMVGTTWMGLTIGCARCHDHKYDPLSQREFYAFYGIFNQADEINIDAPLPDEVAARQAKLPEYEAKRRTLLAPVLADLEALQYRWETKCLEARDHPGREHLWDRQWELLGLVWGGHLGEGQHEGLQIIQIPPSQRTQLQKDRILDYFLKWGSLVDSKKFTELKAGEILTKLDALKAELPPATRAPTMHTSLVLRPNYLHVRGEFRTLGIPVESGVPAVLPPMTAPVALSALATAAGAESDLTAGTHYQPRLEKEPWPNRLALAEWLVSPQHPLTSRVTVNRQWQEFFGRGLVLTSEDFGTQGQKPSHPELLDWLAREFIASSPLSDLKSHIWNSDSSNPQSAIRNPQSWNTKSLHRLIVTSATYRQASRVTPAVFARDPSNVLLARQSPVRLSAETVRDASLAAAGLLYEKLGGPCVFPPQPDSVAMEGFENKWTPSAGPELHRRGLYTWHQRLSPFAQNVTFDSPASGRICSRRERSNTPLQALTLLNDPVFHEAAKALAARVLRDGGDTTAARIDFLFRASVGRPPSEAEKTRLTQFLEEQKSRPTSDSTAPTDAAGWTTAASVLLNLHEFITRE